MEKKYIEEMSKEELTAVFHANEKLQHKILDDMQDSEMHWIGEQLDYVKDSLSNWEIGSYGHSYIAVREGNMNDFLQGLIEMEKSVPAFTEEEGKRIISKLEAAISAYYDADFNDPEYDELEDQAINAVREAAEALRDNFVSRLNYCYETKNQLDYFLDFFADARISDGDHYIKPEEGYKLYRDVSFTESF